MELNARVLKVILSKIPDEVCIGSIDYEDLLHPYDYVKRILLVEKEGEKTLVFNPMGTHYELDKQGYNIIKVWDNENDL